MVLIFFCIFKLTEQWESPCCQTLKQYEVAGFLCYWCFISFFYRPPIRVAMLSEFETISKWRTWYGTDFFCIINLTEQGESPRHQTLKQNPFAELGMLLIFIFLFCHPTIRFAVLLESKTYQVAGLGMVLIFFCIFNITEQWESSCYQTLKQYQVLWNSFFLSPPYQSRHVIRIWNNIKMTDLVWYWFFLHN